MTAKTFWEVLDLPTNSGIDAVEQRFLEVVKTRIQNVAENFDENEVASEEKWLKNFHAQFFAHVLRWAKSAPKPVKAQNHPDAAKLKIEAQTTIRDLQNNIVRYATCYMHLNRFLTLLRDEIKNEEIKAGLSATKMKYTSDTGIAIRRYQKQKRMIVADLERMARIAPMLDQIEQTLGRITTATAELGGKDKTDSLQRSLIAALRTGNFARARKLIDEAANTKKRFGLDQKNADQLQTAIKQTGAALIKMVKENEEQLKGPDDKLYLRPIEISLARDSGQSELRKIRGFLSKYHLPYMQHKVDTLFHLKDKLLVVGSLESLMTLYKQLIAGIAMPMEDLKAVKEYESNILNRVKYLLEAQFEEVPRIHARAKETVSEFRAGRADFAAMQEMELEEAAPDATNEEENADGTKAVAEAG